MPFSQWRKSSRSSPQGHCVEVGFNTDASQTGVRDTKDRSHGTLAVSATRWAGFLDTVKSGRLDLN